MNRKRMHDSNRKNIFINNHKLSPKNTEESCLFFSLNFFDISFFILFSCQPPPLASCTITQDRNWHSFWSSFWLSSLLVLQIIGCNMYLFSDHFQALFSHHWLLYRWPSISWSSFFTFVICYSWMTMHSNMSLFMMYFCSFPMLYDT